MKQTTVKNHTILYVAQNPRPRAPKKGPRHDNQRACDESTVVDGGAKQPSASCPLSVVLTFPKWGMRRRAGDPICRGEQGGGAWHPDSLLYLERCERAWRSGGRGGRPGRQPGGQAVTWAGRARTRAQHPAADGEHVTGREVGGGEPERRGGEGRAEDPAGRSGGEGRRRGRQPACQAPGQRREPHTAARSRSRAGP